MQPEQVGIRGLAVCRLWAPSCLQCAEGLERGLGITRRELVREYRPEIRLRMDGDGEISVRVLYAVGAPVTNYEIVLSGPHGRQVVAVASEDGSFQLRGLPEGEYDVKIAAAPGLQKRAGKVVVQSGKVNSLDVLLESERLQ